MSQVSAARLLRRAAPVLIGLAVLAVVLSPAGIGLSTGATKDTIQDPHFAEIGCTACHGGKAYSPGGSELIHWSIKDAKGAELLGNHYTHDGVYTISITLDEKNYNAAAKDPTHHAGFNLRASSGKLAGVSGISQVTTDGTQATHLNAEHTTWDVTWTAPKEGAAVFDLFVNDVDGDGAPSDGDQVHRVGWYLLDEKGALPGAVSEEEKHFGIELQQYWIGLIGLFGMILVIVAGFFYLKFANPHNTDAKDR